MIITSGIALYNKDGDINGREEYCFARQRNGAG